MAVFLRLAPCPRCSSRERLLIDCAGEDPGGRCTECGEQLHDPLATEVIAEHDVVVTGRRRAWRVRVPAYQDD